MSRTQAEDVARKAHRFQTDKAGRPYIEHVERVAARMRGDDDAEAVAWLHDVLEDAARPWATYVRRWFPAHIVQAVELLTRREDVPAADYYAAIRGNPLALRVKLADIADNSDESRLDLLQPAVANRLRAKYAKALADLRPDNGQRRGAE